jgi:LPS-assembly protein
MNVNAFASIIDHNSIVFFSSDSIVYDYEYKRMRATGSVRMMLDNGDYITADDAIYTYDKKIMHLYGNIIGSNKNGNKFSAEYAELDTVKNNASIKNFGLLIHNGDVAYAKYAQKVGPTEYHIRCAMYTSCSIPSRGRNPIWDIDAKKIVIDMQQERVTYWNAFFKVYGHKVMYIPYLSHPTPNAKAKSGILTPHIKHGNIAIPLYYRAKPNLDFTLTPRIKKQDWILESEARHMLNNGSYRIYGSYNKSNVKYQDFSGKTYKNHKLNRYHLKIDSNFSKDRTQYGAYIERVSDKSYLKNFYRDWRNYLSSQTYVDHYYDNGYILLRGMSFQDLKQQELTQSDNNNKYTIAIPYMIFKYHSDITNDTSIMVKNNFISYSTSNTYKIKRNNLEVTFAKFLNFDTISGHINLYNRLDYYDITDGFTPDGFTNKKNMTRNIPEVQFGMRMPNFFRSNDSSVIIEPKVSGVFASNKKNNQDKDGYIDSYSADVHELNIFSSTHYNGYDYRESGNRISYGINTIFMREKYYVDTFFGHVALSKGNVLQSLADYIGKIHIQYDGKLDLYYRFKRKNKTFAQDSDIIAMHLKHNKLQLNSELIFLKDLTKYYFDMPDYSNLNMLGSIKQSNTSLIYDWKHDISLFASTRLDFSQSKRVKMLEGMIGFIYKLDCLNLDFRIGRYNMYDQSRGIKKHTTYGFEIGLKTISM